MFTVIVRRFAIALISLVAAGLLGGGLPPAAALAQQTPPPPSSRLPYDGLPDASRLPALDAAGAPGAASAVPDALAAPEYAAWSRLVYQSLRNEHDWEIYGARGDGTEQVNLSNHGSTDVYPRLNRGATRVVFASNRDDNYEIYVMNADGSGQTRLTANDASDTYPAWSPDGGRIVFQSYRDGQAELYVMNADGSGQTRLTYHDAYDGEAAWSPDGTQIAFTRRSGDDYRIWAMNADGSAARQLSNQANSENAAWSPDGSQIAYDADGNGDGWQDIWLMDAGGGNQRQVYDPPDANMDALVRSWSPDGRYIACTRVSWIQQSGAWYWKYAYLNAVELPTAGIVMQLGGSGSDWHPDWQKTDFEAPTSSVLPLPAYTRGAQVVVQWEGSDPGGSGVATYDVQVQDADDGLWTDWLSARTETSFYFVGALGHTYRFRVRAVDGAQNVEPWPPDDEACHTTLYNWAISGVVRDSSGSPVHGAIVTTSPAAISAASSDVAGAFDARVGAEAATYTAGAAKAIYGPLPATVFSGAEDAQVAWVLPPADDVVRNGIFETDVLQPDWQVGGALPVVITTTLHHTGGQAVRLGRSSLDFTPPVNLTNSGSDDAGLQMAPDGAGGIHLLWYEGAPGEQQVPLYAWRGQDGAWRAPPGPVPVSGFSSSMMDVGPDGTVHFVGWRDAGGTSQVVHIARSAAGSWSVPVSLGTATHPEYARIAVSATNLVHVVWNDYYTPLIYWTMRDASGAWTEPRDISGPAGLWEPRLALDGSGGVHLVWSEGGMHTRYACRPAAGDWLPPRDLLYGYADPFDLAVDAGGGVHVAWPDGLYAQGSCGGVWSEPVKVTSGGHPTLEVDQGGTVHLLAWSDRMEYVRRSSGGTWSVPYVLEGVPWMSSPPQLAVDDSGTAHVLWCGGFVAGSPETIQLYYTRRSDDPAWTAPVKVSGPAQRFSTEYNFFALAVEGNGRVHAGWRGWTGSISDLFYATSLPIEQAGEAILSQEVTVPPASANPGLSLLYRLGGASGVTDSSFSATVGNGGGTTTLITTGTDTHGWTHRWFDLRDWAGQAVKLTFTLRQAAGAGPAWAALDDISLGSAHPNIWVSRSGPTAAPPGQRFVLTIGYGNAGGVIASNGRVTLQLPAELALISADPPPSATTPELRWDVGDLAAQGEAHTIRVTLQVAPSAARGATVKTVAAITSDTAELEQANNTAEAALDIRALVYLPVIRR